MKTSFSWYRASRLKGGQNYPVCNIVENVHFEILLNENSLIFQDSPLGNEL